MLKNLLWSLSLDFELIFRIKDISAKDKLALILLKYTKYLKDAIFGFKGDSPVRIFQRRYYCRDIFSIASLQRVYCESHHLTKYLKTGSIIIDVGAHIGQFNFFCSHYLGAERIISIEPQQDCFETLKRNAMNTEDCIHSLISDTEGVKTFYVSHTAPQHSSYVKDPGELYQEKMEIPSRTLDSVVQEMSVHTCGLLKVDTEGSEYEVLRSAEKSMEKIDMILVELSVLRSSAGNLFATGSYIQNHGYVLAELREYSGTQKSVDAIFIKNIGQE
jgi:FkbM family methyltransferase